MPTMLFREAEVGEAIDQEKRTVELSFSSETPVRRWWDGHSLEILDHSGNSCDLTRLKRKAPLLLNHDPNDQVGVIEKAWIDKESKKGRCVVRFSKYGRGKEIFDDVVDGIRSSVSVGYEINELRHESESEGVDTYRATSWTPHEVSIVSIPADTSVGCGRANENTQTRMHKILLDPGSAGGGGTSTASTSANQTPPATSTSSTQASVTFDYAGQARAAEAKRTAELFALAKQHNVSHEELSPFIAGGKQPDELRQHILESRYKPQPVDFGKANIGMSQKDVSKYSICRAISTFVKSGRVDGLEGEVSDEARKRYGREFQGMFTIPTDVLNRNAILSEQRALSAASFTGGGALVGEDFRASDFIELLRNQSIVPELGGRMLSGLTGNILIPKQTSASTAYWVSEAASITSSDLALGQLRMVPHALAARSSWSKELMIQSSLDIENLVREDIAKQLAIAKDLAAISGLGAEGQPTGILNTTGVGSVTYGGAPTWAKIVESETTVSAANASASTMGFAISPSTRGKWKTTVKVASQAFFLMEPDGSVNGYKAAVSQQMAASTGANHKSIFGDWSQLVIGDWAGLDVTVNPFTNDATGQVTLTVIQWCDVAVRQPTAFVVSSDAANQ